MLKRIFLYITLILVLGCSNPIDTYNSTISVRAELSRAAKVLKEVTLTVTADDLETITIKSTNNEPLKLEVPYGKTRKFALTLIMTDDSKYYGESTLDISEESTIVSIQLTNTDSGTEEPLTGDITINLSEYTIIQKDFGLGIDQELIWGDVLTLNANGDITGKRAYWYVNGVLQNEISNRLVLDNKFLEIGTYQIIYRVIVDETIEEDIVNIIVNPVNNLPVPGSITSITSTASQIVIQWSPARDNNTLTENLQYKIVMDRVAEDLATPTLADDASRLILMDWTYGYNITKTVSDLIYTYPNTVLYTGTFYVTVLVVDSTEGNIVLYKTMTINIP